MRKDKIFKNVFIETLESKYVSLSLRIRLIYSVDVFVWMVTKEVVVSLKLTNAKVPLVSITPLVLINLLHFNVFAQMGLKVLKNFFFYNGILSAERYSFLYFINLSIKKSYNVQVSVCITC